MKKFTDLEINERYKIDFEKEREKSNLLLEMIAAEIVARPEIQKMFLDFDYDKISIDNREIGDYLVTLIIKRKY